MPLDTRQLRLRALRDTEPTLLVDPASLRNRSAASKHRQVIAEARTTFGELSGVEPIDAIAETSSSGRASVVIRRAFKPATIEQPAAPQPTSQRASWSAEPNPLSSTSRRSALSSPSHPSLRVRARQVSASSEARAHQIAYALTQMEDLDIPHDIAPKRNQRVIATEPLVRSRRRRRVEIDHLFTGTEVAVEQCGIQTRISATKIIELRPRTTAPSSKDAHRKAPTTLRPSTTSMTAMSSMASSILRGLRWIRRFLSREVTIDGLTD